MKPLDVMKAAEVLTQLERTSNMLEQIRTRTLVGADRLLFRGQGEEIYLSDLDGVHLDVEKVMASIMQQVVEGIRQEIDGLRILLLHLGVEIDPPTHRPPPPPEKN